MARQNHDNELVVPLGFEFLELVWKQEDNCEVETDGRIPHLGQKAPSCLERTGTMLSLLDRLSSCWWECQGGDHQIERLCGKVASNARGALRLMRFGLYDESLALARSMGETCNLLYLFVIDENSIKEWNTSTPQQIQNRFSPFEVRQRIEKLQGIVPLDQGRYGLLSERSIHVSPETSPQSYNLHGIPTMGGILQDEGLLMCLNEVARPLCLATRFGALIINVNDEVNKQIASSARDLAEQIGGVTITEIVDYHRHLFQIE